MWLALGNTKVWISNMFAGIPTRPDRDNYLCLLVSARRLLTSQVNSDTTLIEQKALVACRHLEGERTSQSNVEQDAVIDEAIIEDPSTDPIAHQCAYQLDLPCPLRPLRCHFFF